MSHAKIEYKLSLPDDGLSKHVHTYLSNYWADPELFVGLALGIHKPRKDVQVKLTAAQARDLANHLNYIADYVERENARANVGMVSNDNSTEVAHE